MLTIREYLMMNKYKAGERSAASQTPDLFPLMMYIYYAILLLAVLSNFTKSHALRSVSTIQCKMSNNPYLLFRQYAKKKFKNVQCFPSIAMRKRSNRVGSVQTLSPASRGHEDTNTDIFSSSPQLHTLDQC